MFSPHNLHRGERCSSLASWANPWIIKHKVLVVTKHKHFYK